jgi:predicted dehydrogenase
MTGAERRFEVPAEPAPPDRLPGPGPLRWGILGATSTVAQRAVIPAMAVSPKADLVAVASLSARPEMDGVRVHPSYEALLADDEVEAVYIPLPNHLHREWTEQAAAAGKHVLCEKPLAPTAADAAAMADSCADAGVVLAEAYMTPFHPRSRALFDEVGKGRLGLLRAARAGFTFPLRDPANHRWDPACGGGALLDVGVYCLAPLLDLAGSAPRRVSAHSLAAASGVDQTFSAMLEFPGGFTAHVWCSFETPEEQVLALAGTCAAVRIDRAYTPGEEDRSFTVVGVDGESSTVDTGGADPYRGMIDHFQTVVRGGSTLRRPPSASIRVLCLLDRLREAARSGADPGEDG